MQLDHTIWSLNLELYKFVLEATARFDDGCVYSSGEMISFLIKDARLKPEACRPLQ